MDKSRPKLTVIENKREPEPLSEWRCPVCAGEEKERVTLIQAYSGVMQRDGCLDLRTGSREKELRCMTCNTVVAHYYKGRWRTIDKTK